MFLVTIFVLKTPTNAMKHMLLSFKMKGFVISDHFLMLKRFSGYSRFWDLRRGVQRVLNQKVTFGDLNVPMGGESPV